MNLIRELPAMQYDVHNREDAKDGDDHAPEALRYGLMSRPLTAAPKSTIKRNSFDPLDMGVNRRGGYLLT